MRRRLTPSEKEIRSSAGIHVTRFWPFAVMFLAAAIMSCDDQLFQNCLGHPIVGSGRFAIAARLIATIPCSFYALWGSSSQQIEFAAFWGAIPFAALQLHWMRRHRAYWDEVRAREKLKRAERREAKVAKNVP